jgi:hypothetical protein
MSNEFVEKIVEFDGLTNQVIERESTPEELDRKSVV